MATLWGILEETRTRLAAQITELSVANIHITTKVRGFKSTVDRYAAVIFGAGFSVEGFKGGMEMKVVRLNVALIHARSTDPVSSDAARIEMILVQLADKSRVALENQFLANDGALDEGLELLSQGPPEDHDTAPWIRVNQVWRCMYHHLLKDL